MSGMQPGNGILQVFPARSAVDGRRGGASVEREVNRLDGGPDVGNGRGHQELGIAKLYWYGGHDDFPFRCS
jgi:hypothetical protein